MALAKALLERDAHPVILIGTRATGKSVLLASLLSFFIRSPDAGALLSLGDPLLSAENDYGRRVNDKAKRFFNRTVLRFIEGAPPEQTTDAEPYYIPIQLSPVNRAPNASLAILEVSGEHYMLDRNSDVLVKEMREEIATVYADYPAPISIIIVAPYLEGDGYLAEADETVQDYERQRIKDIDLSISFALRDYISRRKDRIDNDRMMILMTKWDVHTGGVADEDFVRAPDKLVEGLLVDRYPTTLNLCATLNQRNNDQVTYDVYSAGPMVGDQILPLDIDTQARVNSHAKRVWNWLYHNVHPGVNLNLKASRKESGGLKGVLGKLFLG